MIQSTSERCEQTSERLSEWPITNILISRSSKPLCDVSVLLTLFRYETKVATLALAKLFLHTVETNDSRIHAIQVSFFAT